MSSDLDALTEAAADGDRAALEELLARHLSALRAYVRVRAGAEIRRHEASSDLVQSVCREILEHAGRFRHPSEAAFRRWLFTTALRKIVDRHKYLRAEKRAHLREVTAVDEEQQRALLDAYASFCTPSRDAALDEEYARVEAAMDQLTEEQREVVTLAHLAGLSRAEIAEHLGKKEGTVRMTLHRAMAKLGVLLRERDE